MKSSEIELKRVVCGNPIHVIEDCADSPPEIAAWDGAIVDTILGGYGSKFDDVKFVIGICDNCIANSYNLIKVEK